MNEILKKIILYFLAFLALWVCSVIVFWVIGLFLATNTNEIIWDGFKAAILAFIILFAANRFSRKKE